MNDIVQKHIISH